MWSPTIYVNTKKDIQEVWVTINTRELEEARLRKELGEFLYGTDTESYVRTDGDMEVRTDNTF